MKHGPKCKTIKLLKENMKENLCYYDLGLGKKFQYDTKRRIQKKMGKMHVFKIKIFGSSNYIVKRMKKYNPQTGRKYVQGMYLMKNLYSKYIKNS